MPGPKAGVHVAAAALLEAGTKVDATTMTIAAMVRISGRTFDESGRYGPVLRFCFFLIRPLELRQRGSGDAAGFEPLVTVSLAAGAVGPSALFRDVEWTGWIDGRLAPMGLAYADELDESAVHCYRPIHAVRSG